MNKILYLAIGIFAVAVVVFYMKNYTPQKEITPEIVEEYAGAEGYTNDQRSIVNLLRNPEVESIIDIDEVLSGGVPKDGIPSIEKPIIVPIAQAPEWLPVGGDGIAVTIGQTSRFYPYQVLVGHEIVNDIIEDTPVLVTYCPLCYTGIVFDPIIDGKRTAFGVSGFLYESNLLMYNRSAPESLWSQAAGEAVIGQHAGTELGVLNFDITTQAAFAGKYPAGEVVIGDAESPRSYTRVLYGGNLRDIDSPFGASGKADDRLGRNAIVMGLEIDGQARAYHVQAVALAGEFTEEFAGRTLRVVYEKEIGAMRVFDVTDGDEVRLSPFPSFWFSWASTHPETTVYK